ncbi:MAG: response regulator transcription factor [Bacillota bacterium]
MGSDPTILIVDDERGFVEGLTANLEREGWTVITAPDGESAIDRFEEETVDLVLLDLMLPGIDGMEVCRRLRRDSTVPIIMLTAKDDDIDKILGLEVGADDYITKPFNFRELLARIRAVMRRVNPEPVGGGEQRFPQVAPGIVLDTERRTLSGPDGQVPLTVKEFAVMQLLAKHPGRVFSREQILDRAWGYDYFGSSRTVDVHVRRLRKKIEALGPTSDGSEIIKTRWGAGYLLEIDRQEQGP